jgi:zinc protease
MDEVITEKLENGLTIKLKEIHTAPIISHWVWYRVGSRNETPGCTGISHWVEHMQFKGTPDFPGGILDKTISREGGYWNAFTYLDWTAYFEVLPAGKIDIALRLEADRMVNSIYEPSEVNSERTVILSEKEGQENDPYSRLSQMVQEKAFDYHPYKNEVIGCTEDLHAIQRDNLYDYYRRNYVPNNAVIALSGDFNTRDMLARLTDLYGNIPAGEPVLPDIKPEPQLNGNHYVELAGPGDTTYLKVVYRAPEGRNKDFFALSVLDSLLSGPSGLNMFGGGGISNKTSRLYKNLVENELAVGISGGLQVTIDPYLYSLMAIVHPQKSADAVLEQINAEISRLQENPVSSDEIHRAIKQAKALFAYGSESITNQGFWLGNAEMFADYTWFKHYVDELEKITAADIQRAAQVYLDPSRRVVGVYKPEDGGSA